jgi:hypothetical protein
MAMGRPGVCIAAARYMESPVVDTLAGFDRHRRTVGKRERDTGCMFLPVLLDLAWGNLRMKRPVRGIA